jgi:hypothetical protein
VAALATEVKVDIENGFGTWKVKLKVNILLCFWGSPSRGEGIRYEGKKTNKWKVGLLQQAAKEEK